MFPSPPSDLKPASDCLGKPPAQGDTPRIVKRALAIFLLAAPPLAAQPPRAEPVDPALLPDAENDFFMRGKNLYDAAQKSADMENRIALYQRAADIFTQYLADFPNHPNAEMAWWHLGNSHYQSGSIEEAKRCFHTLLNRFGQGVWAAAAAYTLAADHYNKGEYAFAAPLFERYAANAAKPEERPRGYYFAGNCYRMLGRDRDAITAFRKVTEDPAGGLFAAQSKLALGHLALRAGKLEDALATFEEVVTQYPTPKYRGEAALQAALTATKLGRGEISEKYLRLILVTEGMEDFRPDAQTALMANHFAKKEYRKVIEVFRRNTAKGEGEREAARLMLAGRAHLRLKQANDASNLFREIERILPPESDLAFQASYYRLLCFFQIEGRHVPDQVDAFLQIYRQARPNDARIHTALMMKAETLFSQKQIVEAAKVYSEVDASAVSDKNRPGLLYQRGWCLAEAGDHQGAIRSLSEFIAKYPEDTRLSSALAKRAKAYADVGEPAKAIADFDRLTAAGAPDDLAAFGWLESARMRRSEGNIQDMVVRYKGLLGKVDDLSDNLQAEANYWIGWGLVKTNVPAEAVDYLEKARELRPSAYGKHAGLLLSLGYYASQNPQKLAAELNLAIDGEYISDIPDQAIEWAGMQAYNALDFKSAARFLELVANPDEPRETGKGIWRYLAKSHIQTGNAKDALPAVNNVLAVEENPGWKADGLVDKGRVLLMLDRTEEARKAADEAFELRPQGRTSATLRILSGDLHLHMDDFARAAAEYQYVVNFHEDKDLKPLAMDKLAGVLEKQGGADEAAKIRRQLARDFPSWQKP